MAKKNTDSILISDELFICWNYFDEIVAFIKTGMPERFSKLRETYLGEKYYYTHINSKRLYEKENSYSPIAFNCSIKGKKLEDEYGGIYDYVYSDSDSDKIYWKKIIDQDSANQNIYEKRSKPHKMSNYQWSIDESVNKKDVWEAISIFFQIGDYANGNKDYGAVNNAISESIKVMALKKYVLDNDKPIIISSAEAVFTWIVSCLGFNFNDGRSKTLDEKMNDWCKICGIYNTKNGTKGVNKEHPFANIMNMLKLYRAMRNDMDHKGRLVPGLRDAISFSVYLCITIIYLSKKYKGEQFSEEFESHLNSHDDVCKLQCKTKEEIRSGNQGELPFYKSDGEKYYLLEPFQDDYTIGDKNLPLNIDIECHGASILISGDSVNIVKKQYRFWENLPNEQFLVDALTKNDFNNKVEDIISFLNEDKDVLDSIKNGLLELQESITETVKKEDLWQAIEKLDGLTITIKTIEEGIHKINVETGNISKDTKKINKDIEKTYKGVNKLLSLLLILFIVLVGVGGYYYYETTYNTADKAFSRKDYETAHYKGHLDAAYEYARQLEKQGKLELASEWYRKAIESYESFLQKFENKSDTFDIERRYRLAQLYIRAKGGYYEPYKAYCCLEPVQDNKQTIGLYTYCCALLEKEQEVVNKLYYAKEDTTDHYLFLTKAILQLQKPELMEGYLEKDTDEKIWKKLRALAPKLEEVRLSIGLTFLNGFFDNTGKLIYRLWEGMDALEASAKEDNSVWAQLIAGQMYARMQLLDVAESYLTVACRNGSSDAMFLLKSVASAMKKTQKADSLENEIKRLQRVDTFLLNNMDLKKRTPLEALNYRKKGVNAFDSAKLSVTEYYFKEYVQDLLKSNTSLDKVTLFGDTITNSMKKYLYGVKYAKGYGVKKNQAIADSLIEAAATEGSREAIYTWGRLLYQRGNTLESIAMLRRTADFDAKSAEFLSYIYRSIDKGKSAEYLKQSNDTTRLYRLIIEQLSSMYNATEKASVKQLATEADELEAALCQNKFSDFKHSSFVAGQLALIYALLGAPNSVIQFYLAIACNNVLNGEGYFFLVNLTELFRGQNKLKEAADCYEQFCLIYFGRKGADANLTERKSIVDYLRCYFPESETRIKKELGFDFTEGIERTYNKYCFPPDNFEIDLQPNDSIYAY